MGVHLENSRRKWINDQYWTLRAEELSAEEAGAGPNDRQLHVYHFHRQQEHASMIHNFGDPFRKSLKIRK